MSERRAMRMGIPGRGLICTLRGCVPGVARGSGQAWKQSMKAEDFGKYAY